MTLRHVAARAFDTPLLIDPGKAAAIAVALGGRMLGGAIELAGPSVPAVDHVAGRARLGVVGDGLGRAYAAHGVLPFEVIEGVAVIPIEGTLVHKGGYVGAWSGETSYEGIQTQVRAALRANEVRGVVLEVDSYGGEAAGAFDTADIIAELSARKPTLAILTDVALSAGYLLASAARQVVAPQFGKAGSIGVLTLHVDRSGQLAKEGIRITMVHAGARKTEGNECETLGDETRQRMQVSVDAMWSHFAGRIAIYRAGRTTADQVIAMDGATFGADEAQRLGLIDGIGSADAAFAAFIAAINGSSS